MKVYWQILQLLEIKDRSLDELIEIINSKKSNIRHKIALLRQDSHDIFKKNGIYTMKRNKCKACGDHQKSINSIVCVKCHLK